VATSPPMNMKEIESQLKLDKRLHPFLENRESPLLLTVLQWMLPVSFVSLILFGWIYRRTYRAQFRD
ncbi:MAG TPA: hypothetical protein PLN21_21050, partial [Gemmatales bacterium]|nr:hypothetical protein [Gemmatales bacterium]